MPTYVCMCGPRYIFKIILLKWDFFFLEYFNYFFFFFFLIIENIQVSWLWQGAFLPFIAALLWSWEMFPYSLECALNCPYFQPAEIEQDLYTAINSFQYSSEVYKKLEGAKGYLYKRKLFLNGKLSLRPSYWLSVWIFSKPQRDRTDLLHC